MRRTDPRHVRFAIEAAAIVVVAVAVGAAHLGRTTTYVSVGAVWAVIGAIEYRLSRR
jgi:hypothetical protein